MKKLPTGKQTFETLIKNNFVYVDKTEHIWNLVNGSGVYFLSRPRRFGKSVLIGTLEQLFKGYKELFKDLYIYDKWDWTQSYPVIHLNFSEADYKSLQELQNDLIDFINSIAEQNNLTLTMRGLNRRFSQLLQRLHEKYNQQVVVLVDEYDKPITDNLFNPKLLEANKITLHDFYQVLKAADEHLQFVFFTAVSKISGLSVFSTLNNLKEALKQIKDKKYSDPYLDQNKKIIFLAIAFNGKDVMCKMN